MKKLVIATLSACALAACGGGNSVEQYVVNVDAQQQVTKGPNANCSDADPKITTTTTDEKSGTVLSVYTTADGTSYAELGDHVYTGKAANGTYNLTDNASTEDRTQTNRDYVKSDLFTLQFKADGDFVSGTLSHEHHESCNGSNCSNQESQTIDCIYATNLRGSKLPDNGSLAELPSP